MEFFGTEIECTLPLIIDDLMVADVDCFVWVSDNGCGGIEIDYVQIDDLRDGIPGQCFSKNSEDEQTLLWKTLSDQALNSAFVKEQYCIKKREHDCWEAA